MDSRHDAGARRVALYLIAVIVVAATVTAFVQSYEGVYVWATRYLSDGWARTWPLQVDAWIAVGELMLYLAYRGGWRVRRRFWPWFAALTGLVVSTAFNVGHLPDADLAGQVTAAVPPIAAFGGLFLGLQVLKHAGADNGRVDESPSAGPRLMPLPVAVQLAGLMVAADRASAGQVQHDQPVNGYANRQEQAATSRRGRRLAPAVQARAAQIVRSEPQITGTELARRVGIPERSGRRLLERVSSWPTGTQSE